MKKKKLPGKTYILLFAGLLVLFVYQLITIRNEYRRERDFLMEDIRQSLILADYSEVILRESETEADDNPPHVSMTAFMDNLGFLGIGIGIHFMNLDKPPLLYCSKTPKPINLKKMADFEAVNRLTMLATHSATDQLTPIYYNVLDSLLQASFRERHLLPNYHLSLVSMAKGDSILQDKHLSTSHIFDTEASPLVSRRFIGGNKEVKTFQLEDLTYKAPIWENRTGSTYLYAFDLGRQNAYLLEIGNIPMMILGRIVNIILFSAITFILIAFLIILLISKNLRLMEMKERETAMMQNMTHELKTPIAVSLAAVEALSDEEYPLPEEKRQKYYGILQDKLDELSERISRILHPMQLRQQLTAGGRIRLKDIPPVNLLETVRPLAEDITFRTNGEAHLQIDIPSDIVLHIRKEDLCRILANLFDNAVKYSPASPSIAISARKRRHRILVEVADKGYGIPKRELYHIFDRFYRVESGPAQTVRGTGVGLNDVRETILAYHGKVNVKSELGKGSCFTLIFRTI